MEILKIIKALSNKSHFRPEWRRNFLKRKFYDIVESLVFQPLPDKQTISIKATFDPVSFEILVRPMHGDQSLLQNFCFPSCLDNNPPIE